MQHLNLTIKYMIIISRARNRETIEGEYYEKHHVIPRCCGGTDDKNNIVKLTAQEHYEAHKELAYANPKIDGLQYAWWSMAVICGREITKEDFAELRKRYAELIGKRKGENHPCYGKPGAKWTDERRAKVMAYWTEERRAENGKKYGQSNAGRKHTEEEKALMRKNHANVKGKNNPNYGKHLKPTRQDIMIKITCDEHPEWGIFESLTEAQRRRNEFKCTETNRNGIKRYLNGKQKYCGKDENGIELHWTVVS